MHNAAPPTAKNKLPGKPYQKWFTAKTVVLLAGAVIVTFAVTRFFEKLHYDNLLTQSASAQTSLQSQASAYQHDARFLIAHASTSVNCYQLSAPGDRQLCSQHNQ